MTCSNCGTEIEKGLVFCPKCGQEIEMVPTYDLLDDELEALIIERKKKAKKRKEVRKRNFGLIFTVFIISVVIVVSVIIYTAYINSFSYHMKKADAAYANSYMTEAIAEYKACINSSDAGASGNSLYRAYLGLANSQYAMADYTNAEENVKKALTLYPTSVDAYKTLLSIYNATGNEKQISYLKATVKDTEILTVINTYYVGTPVFSKTPGEYTDDIKLFLSTSDGSKIYYTLNGSDPKINGFEYKGAILLTEGITNISAVCQNSSGHYGQIVSFTYSISYPDPDYPVLTPDGGEYYEPTWIKIKVPSGCEAYYTWDGSDPKTNGILYTEPILMEDGNNVLSVVVKNNKGRYSDIYRSNYKFY